MRSRRACATDTFAQQPIAQPAACRPLRVAWGLARGLPARGRRRRPHAALPPIALAWHAEPSNALSLPTWVVHTSSVVEWIVAIKLVVRFAQITGRRAFYNLAWGMLPLHTSSLCACTYHLFYNANEVIDLVTLQAALTFAGNGALALAAASIAKESAASPTPAAPRPPATATAEDAADDRTYYASGLALCVALAAAVKYGSLATDLTLRPSLGAAAALVLLPTAALATDVALSQRR